MKLLLTESDIQLAFAKYLRNLREQEKLSREALAEKSTVPAATIKKFERTGQISFRQLLLLWQSLDDLQRLFQLIKEQTDKTALPNSIDEILKDGI
ncbi:helix-turn-helix domain-containing protein [Thalassomonas viridans]|uniref:Helix-turn-helix domain-containing protein n=1 Tax=Thalassomonas viridans TaxID=137584 RepID=A0AAE9Z2N3_9GAMM|nr:helix-turn-helix transcriptional regulator [Thalassomonas viridans]WDE04924.1 helix-turn-helix domain-containing protein [Thalassomonas viridans]